MPNYGTESVVQHAVGVVMSAAGLWGPTVSGIVQPEAGKSYVVTTAAAHGLTTGQVVAIAGVTGATGLNASWPVRVLTPTTFELVGTGAISGAAAGAITAALPDIDISPFASEWYIRIQGIGNGVVSLEDTVNNWGAAQPRFLFNFRSNSEGDVKIISWRDWKGGDRFGTASAKMRLRVISVPAGETIKLSVAVSGLIAS